MAKLLTAIDTVIKVITLGPALLPPAPQGSDSLVRIFAADFDTQAFQASFGVPPGWATPPAMAAFNSAGDVIGVANTDSNFGDNYGEGILNGEYRDYTIQQQVGQHQLIEYLQIYATQTPICLAAVTMRYPDGEPSAFSGDFGRVCGAAWYYSNVYLDEDAGYQPDCVWLDSGIRDEYYSVGSTCTILKWECNHYGTPCPDCDEYDTTPQYQLPSGLRFLPKALQYTVSNFGRRPLISGHYFDSKDPEAYSKDPKFYCNEDSLTLRHYLNTVFYPKSSGNNIYFDQNDVTLFEQGSDLDPNEKWRARAATEAAQPDVHYDFYVASTRADHSAIKLCTSITSVGPDFYSVKERKFCDMAPASMKGTKRLFDACARGDALTLPCFDTDKHKIRRASKERRSSNKNYKYQIGWGEKGEKTVMDLLTGAMITGLMSNTTAGYANATTG